MNADTSSSTTAGKEPLDWLLAVQEAAQVLQRGGVVAYPSETVWGLAALPESADALERLYALKGRAADKPVQLSCESLETAQRFARPSAALTALSSLWPGPLTLVTTALPGCPERLAPRGQVGLRVPDHPVAQALLHLVGGVLATTSCNRSGEPPATTWKEAAASGLGDVTLPEGGQPAAGLASTVVLLPEGLVQREGAVTAAQIRALLGPLEPDRG
ncbi:L-threonylcarbamoyladenylate synthase [Deinococcus navajonensis]|uniref:L-threonylcarbamoyladenylate synthase n=1 Tax=Deinococcus navajonensis TaxID=309884 RepID=A0ABV8XT36_9DEIO